jgi:uncharacterized protein with HEPN domain
MRDPREQLRDMFEAINHVERYAARSREAFEQDQLIQVWIVHHFQVIGEAAAQLGRNFHDAHPEVPWPQIVAMRNILVHEYVGVRSPMKFLKRRQPGTLKLREQCRK